MAGHVHDMKPHAPGVLKCSSCAFRCTTSALPAVKRSAHLHRRIRATDPRAKTVWNG